MVFYTLNRARTSRISGSCTVQPSETLSVFRLFVLGVLPVRSILGALQDFIRRAAAKLAAFQGSSQQATSGTSITRGIVGVRNTLGAFANRGLRAS